MKTKSFHISKAVVWQAWLLVKANQGAAGVDAISIAEFEQNLKGNLYKIWNRMSSGCYFPPPVRRVFIPKAGGGERPLGIPTVGDRVAQMVVKLSLEPLVEPSFHPDSYGYRPGKSALDAVGQARRRCWRFAWVLDLDIKGFFDTIDHDLLMHAVRKHTKCAWMLLYLGRWLKVPAVLADGTELHRDRGTPQGGVVSPLLANIFLHHVFDAWMTRKYPDIPFERYADDIVVHCTTEAQAQFLREQIERRLCQCRLELHPEKTKIIYCKDEDRPGSYCHERFDFLGFTFRPRRSKTRWGKCFINFSPAMSDTAQKTIRKEIRHWHLSRKSDKSLLDLAHMFNAKIRGWITYYGTYYKSAMYSVFRQLNRCLVRWAQQKYGRHAHQRNATHWLRGIAQRQPRMLAHWQLGVVP